MAGAETLLPLSLMLVRDGLVSMERLFAMLATNPASVLGVDSGTLAVGQPADLLLLDPRTAWRIDGEAFVSAGNTPFHGLPVEGRAVTLWKGGRELIAR
jgi:dihydroorotase